MKTVLITGAQGFIGRNLTAILKLRKDLRLYGYDLGNTESELRHWASKADVIFHLAGVNRPNNPAEFESGNAGSVEQICLILDEAGRSPQIILSSSVQAELQNPYGVSKRRSEEMLRQFAARHRSPLAIFRFKNVFGKWCRPNYNSVVATFCHNIAHDLPIQITDPNRELELVHVDDVVSALSAEMDCPQHHEEGMVAPDGIPSYSLTLADLASRIRGFRDMHRTLQTPDFSVQFNRQLYSTYQSYVEPSQWAYRLESHGDSRGTLAEFIKSPAFGQIFVSQTRPGVTRGNHYHHTKTEKFLVLAGEGLIRLRHVDKTEIQEFHVRGEDYQVVDIPPGHAHSITNVGTTELVTLFWSSEIYEPERSDTYVAPIDISEANPREAEAA